MMFTVLVYEYQLMIPYYVLRYRYNVQHLYYFMIMISS